MTRARKVPSAGPADDDWVYWRRDPAANAAYEAYVQELIREREELNRERGSKQITRDNEFDVAIRKALGGDLGPLVRNLHQYSEFPLYEPQQEALAGLISRLNRRLRSGVYKEPDPTRKMERRIANVVLYKFKQWKSARNRTSVPPGRTSPYIDIVIGRFREEGKLDGLSVNPKRILKIVRRRGTSGAQRVDCFGNQLPLPPQRLKQS